MPNVFDFVTSIAWWDNQTLILHFWSGAVVLTALTQLANILDVSISVSPNSLFMTPMTFSGNSKATFFLEQSMDIKNAAGGSVDKVFYSLAAADDSIVSTLQQSFFNLLDGRKPTSHSKNDELMETRTYRLVSLQSLTPLEVMHGKIKCDDYAGAIAVAQKYSLSTDLVFKIQWSKNMQFESAITSSLAKVTDLDFVLDQCLSYVPKSLAAACDILDLGVEKTSLDVLISGTLQDISSLTVCNISCFIYWAVFHTTI